MLIRRSVKGHVIMHFNESMNVLKSKTNLDTCYLKFNIAVSQVITDTLKKVFIV